MCFYTHQNIRRLNTYDKIIISEIFYYLNLIKSTLYKSLCCNTIILFNNILFKRTAVNAYSYRYISWFSNIYYCFYLVSRTNITRIYPDLISTIFHGSNRHLIVKMYISYEWYMNLFFYFLNSMCRFYSRNCTSYDITSCFFKP